MMHDRFFWLHIKKSAGQSTRRALDPLYRETDRGDRPGCFGAKPREEWNDILNTYHIPLGDWQFRRSEFARRVLWPDRWDVMVRLAFVRHPLDRCVSMFHYLFDYRIEGHGWVAYRTYLLRRGRLGRRLPRALLRRLPVRTEVLFDQFLDALGEQEEVRGKGPNAAPFDLHFATHTNPMSNDVLSESGASNLSHLVRLDCFEAGIDLVYRELGVERPSRTRGVVANRTQRAPAWRPTPEQARRVEALFARDFDLYEDALAPAPGGHS